MSREQTTEDPFIDWASFRYQGVATVSVCQHQKSHRRCNMLSESHPVICPLPCKIINLTHLWFINSIIYFFSLLTLQVQNRGDAAKAALKLARATHFEPFEILRIKVWINFPMCSEFWVSFDDTWEFPLLLSNQFRRESRGRMRDGTPTCCH